jgi:ribonuclease P protein component
MQRLTFPRRCRLSRDADFQRALRQGCRKPRGPLTFHIHPNDLKHCRLGLSIGRRFGSAVARHRLKRLLREAFRLSQHDLPAGYDIVVTARRHQPLPLDRYRELLRAAADSGAREWRRRVNRPEEQNPGRA